MSRLPGAIRARLEEALGAVERGGPARRRAALDALTPLLLGADPVELGADVVARASQAGVPEDVLSAASSAPPHAVLVPLVVDGVERAVIRTFYVSLDPIGGSDALQLEPATEKAVAAAIVAGRQLGGARGADPYRLVAARPESLAGTVIGGESLGAAALVSSQALASGRAAVPGVVVSGRLSAGRVLSVGAIGPKVEAAVEIGARSIVVPQADRREAERVARGRIEVRAVGAAEALASHALSVATSAADLDDLVTRALAAARHGWRGYRWAEARELLERALALVPRSALDRRLELYARYAAAERHLGALERSTRILAHAERTLRAPNARHLVGHDARSRAHQQMAMTALACGRFVEARRFARAAVVDARRAGSGRDRMKALGCVGLVAKASGRHAEAARAFADALALTRALTPEDGARSRAYLAGALLRAGEARRARREHALALAETVREASASKAAWVRCEWAHALLDTGHVDEAAKLLDDVSVRDAIARTPVPGLLLRRHLARTHLARGEEARAIALLFGGDVGPGSDASARLSADVNAWIALAVLARRGPLSEPDRARLDESIARVGERQAVAAYLGTALRRTAHARPHELTAALEALVARAAPLA